MTIEAIREALDNLEEWIEGHYTPETRKYPGEERNYKRDMAVVVEARKALTALEAPVDVEALRRECIKAACWQNKEECHCDHAAGGEAAFDYLYERGLLGCPEWRPIDTAPRDGTHALLCVPGENLDYKKGTVARCIGYWAPKYTLPCHDDVYEPEKYPKSFEYQESSGEWFATEGFYTFTFENHYGDEIARSIQPTHWMPLPATPNDRSE